jgi:hypothetical protein
MMAPGPGPKPGCPPPKTLPPGEEGRQKKFTYEDLLLSYQECLEVVKTSRRNYENPMEAFGVLMNPQGHV